MMSASSSFNLSRGTGFVPRPLMRQATVVNGAGSGGPTSPPMVGGAPLDWRERQIHDQTRDPRTVAGYIDPRWGKPIGGITRMPSIGQMGSYGMAPDDGHRIGNSHSPQQVPSSIERFMGQNPTKTPLPAPAGVAGGPTPISPEVQRMFDEAGKRFPWDQPVKQFAGGGVATPEDGWFTVGEAGMEAMKIEPDGKATIIPNHMLQNDEGVKAIISQFGTAASAPTGMFNGPVPTDGLVNHVRDTATTGRVLPQTPLGMDPSPPPQDVPTQFLGAGYNSLNSRTPTAPSEGGKGGTHGPLPMPGGKVTGAIGEGSSYSVQPTAGKSKGANAMPKPDGVSNGAWKRFMNSDRGMAAAANYQMMKEVQGQHKTPDQMAAETEATAKGQLGFLARFGGVPEGTDKWVNEATDPNERAGRLQAALSFGDASLKQKFALETAKQEMALKPDQRGTWQDVPGNPEYQQLVTPDGKVLQTLPKRGAKQEPQAGFVDLGNGTGYFADPQGNPIPQDKLMKLENAPGRGVLKDDPGQVLKPMTPAKSQRPMVLEIPVDETGIKKPFQYDAATDSWQPVKIGGSAQGGASSPGTASAAATDFTKDIDRLRK